MAKFRTHIYKPNGGNLKIVIEAPRPIYKDGQKVWDEPGKYADFAGGIFETDDEEIIKKLKNLSTFGVDFFEVPANEPAQAEIQSSGPNLEAMTKGQLLELAKEKGIEVDEKLTKPQILELLEAK